VHAFAAFNLIINVISWFEWVNTKANIADLPSRDDFRLLQKIGSKQVELVLPDIAAWDAPGRHVDAAGDAGSSSGRPNRRRHSQRSASCCWAA